MLIHKITLRFVNVRFAFSQIQCVEDDEDVRSKDDNESNSPKPFDK